MIPDFLEFGPRVVGEMLQLASMAIPVPAVALVAFHFVKHGMNPRRGGVAFQLLDNAVGLVPLVDESQVNGFAKPVIHIAAHGQNMRAAGVAVK